MILLLSGCMPLDGFFFNATPVDAYVLGDNVVPAPCTELDAFDGDGVTLHGVWTWQGTGDACTPDPTAPVLVYFHGNTGNIDEYWARQEDYWRYGWSVYQVDYRGYGMSSGTPSFDGVIADGLATIDHVSDITGLASSEMDMLGLSLGGFVAVHNLLDRPPRRFISEDMFASVGKMLEDGTELYIPPGWVVEEDWDNLRPLAAMDPAIPHLVIHGDSDTFVQPEHAALVYEASASADKAKWLVTGSDHAEDAATDPEGYEAHVTCWFGEADPTSCGF